MKLNGLSVFFPAYNEEANIIATLEKALKILPEIASKWEILVVNDGSKDKTGEIVSRFSKKHRGVTLVNHEVNRGYGAAFKSGLYNAKYDWITFTDADGQFDFGEIANFIAKQRETKADLVVGYYKKRQVSQVKILTSKMWEVAVLLLFGLHVHDIDCGFKLIAKRVVRKIPELTSERGAFISSEFLIKAKRSGFTIVEIPVTHYPRLKGEGTGRKLNVIVESFKDLFKLWLNLK